MYFIKGCENIKSIKKNKIRIIIVSSLILLIFFAGYCFAKYEISRGVFAKSKIAIPVLEVEGHEGAKISAINNSGYYDFVVKNYNENNVSDVPLNYTIEVISNTDESVEFKLYKEDEEIDLINNKTNQIYIEGIRQKEHIYKLEVNYDKTKSNSQQDILEDVQIKVNSEQARV